MSDATNKAVFLSYASQDAEAARRIADALRAAGVEVWFDQNELVGGDAWDAKIRKQIKECALFVPVISAATQARHEGYFRLEWKLAAERTHLMSGAKAFLLPVVIDDTRDADAYVPEEFRAVQWTRLPGGETPAAFCTRVGSLLEGELKMEPDRSRPGQRDERVAASGVTRSADRRWLVPTVLGIAAVIALAVWRPWRASETFAPTTDAIVRPPVQTEAQLLVAKAWEQLNRPGRARTQLEIADDLCRRATALSPDDADAWAAWSQVHTWQIYNALDLSSERRESARAKAQRALQLNPNSFEARFAEAAYLVRSATNAGSGRSADDSRAGEERLRALLVDRPNEPRVCFALGISLRNAGKDDEAQSMYERMAATPAFAVEAWAEKAWLFWMRGKFPAALDLCDRSLAQEPFSGNLLLRIYLALTWTGDLELAKSTVENLAPGMLQDDKLGSFAARVYWWRREPAQMIHVLNGIPRAWITWWDLPKSYLTGQAHAMRSAKDAAQISWSEALRQVETRAAHEPEVIRHHLWRAELLGLLERRAEADASMRLARSFGFRGPSSAFSTPSDWSVAVANGDVNAALDSLEKGYDGKPVWPTTWAVLRYNPQFDSLRDEPRFKALLARAESDPQRCPHAK